MWLLLVGAFILCMYTLGLIIFCVRKINTIEEPIEEDTVPVPKYVGIDVLKEEVRKDVNKLS